ncbi:MAG: hypothetical protein RIF46_12055, partial [Cyclobacteriaceae bacterium]
MATLWWPPVHFLTHAEFKHPKQVILIASAQNANELPKRYTFQRRLPLYKLVGPKLSKWGA